MRPLFVLIGATLLFAGCRKTSNPPVAADVTLADSADQVIFDGRFFVTQQGIRRGILRADTIYVFNDNSKVLMKKVRGTFNTETGAPNGTLEGGRGTYDRRLRVLDGYDSVVVTSTEGDRLTSNHLRYTEAKDEISSDSAYTIVKKGDVSRGIGFRSDPNLRDFRCLRQCTGSANVPITSINP